MGVSGQRHAPAALYPRGKDPRYPLDRRLGGPQKPVWTQRIEEKSFCPCRGSNPGRPARSQTLYCLSYPGSNIYVLHNTGRFAVDAPCHFGHADRRYGSPVLRALWLWLGSPQNRSGFGRKPNNGRAKFWSVSVNCAIQGLESHTQLAGFSAFLNIKIKYEPWPRLAGKPVVWYRTLRYLWESWRCVLHRTFPPVPLQRLEMPWPVCVLHNSGLRSPVNRGLKCIRTLSWLPSGADSVSACL
jgi:hypothetical protein